MELDDHMHEPTVNSDGLVVCRVCGLVLDNVVMLDLSKKREPRYTLESMDLQFDMLSFKLKPHLYREYKRFKQINPECAKRVLSRIKFGKHDFERSFQNCVNDLNKEISALANRLNLPISIVHNAYMIGRNRVERAKIILEHMSGIANLNMILKIMKEIEHARNTLR